MNVVFYLSAAIAVIATILVVTRVNAMHALLYLIVSLLAVAIIFYTLGAPFIAALEVIVYAGAIMVLFIFAIMLLNLGPHSEEQERIWMRATGWAGPVILAALLLAEIIYIIIGRSPTIGSGQPIQPAAVGAALYGPYLIGVELASILLLAALVGAYHLGHIRRALREASVEAAALRARTPESRPTGEQEPLGQPK